MDNDESYEERTRCVLHEINCYCYILAIK